MPKLGFYSDWDRKSLEVLSRGKSDLIYVTSFAMLRIERMPGWKQGDQ